MTNLRQAPFVCGFTGTRKGMNQTQKDIMGKVLARRVGEFHHGDCIGADAEAHDIAMICGYRVTVHPPTDESLRAFKAGHIILPAEHYLARNRAIVHASNILIATPHDNSGRGGTWYTIKYARSKGMDPIVIMPNGELLDWKQ